MTTGYKIEDLAANAGTEVRESAKDYPHIERCPRCGGDGTYRRPSSRGHQCFKCKGTGTLKFKKSATERAAARKKAAVRKEAKADQLVEDFKVAQPIAWAWIEAGLTPRPGRGINTYAIAMHEGIRKFGSLTENQLIAVLRNVERDAEAKEAAKAREAAAPEISLANINEAFDRAAKRLKRPRLSIATYVFTHAGANSANVGALYVKREGTYLGKIMNGKFIAVRSTTPEEIAQVLKIAADPKAAAVEHGRLSGNCAICNRLLTNEESVKYGIGPICASNFGW